MQKELSRETVVEIYQALNVLKRKTGILLEQKIKFNHAVSRNLQSLNGLYETINETNNNHLKEYKKEMNLIGEKFSEKDINDKPILLENGNLNINKKELFEYTKQIDECNDKYKSIMEEIKIYMRTIESIELYMINFSEIPQIDKEFQNILICIDPIINYEE